jgi:hypothetical protein
VQACGHEEGKLRWRMVVSENRFPLFRIMLKDNRHAFRHGRSSAVHRGGRSWPGRPKMLKVWGRRSSFNVQKVMWLIGELGQQRVAFRDHIMIPFGELRGCLDF